MGEWGHEMGEKVANNGHAVPSVSPWAMESLRGTLGISVDAPWLPNHLRREGGFETSGLVFHCLRAAFRLG